jgi:hypothetical protein
MTYFIPRGLFRFILETANEHKLSIKEVQISLLRSAAEEFGFTCDHMEIGYAKSTGLPYCEGCWTRMEEIVSPKMGMSKRGGKKVIITPGQYKPLSNFIEWERRTRNEAEQGAALKKMEGARQMMQEEEQQQKIQQQKEEGKEEKERESGDTR